ncbi:MAG: helix-turn-helix transcriptional regulator [Clostridia bacterium]|jgi:Predicted transcriptional regulators|nr:helix-turn-helix transcriptional regulator [Clostridia bacterium]
MNETLNLCGAVGRCPMNYAMSLIGGKWKMQILCSLNSGGTMRYNALKRRVAGISNTVLAAALRELEADGLVRREEYLEVPIRVEYTVTEAGREVVPILEQLTAWAQKRMRQEAAHEAG